MFFFSKFLIPLCAAGAFVSAAGAQTAQPAPKPQLTPRELFYSAGPASDTPHKAPPKDGGKGSKGSTPKGTGSKANPDPIPHGGGELPGGGHIVNASSGPPIGITYTLQRKAGDNMADVAPESVFHKDDRIAF